MFDNDLYTTGVLFEFDSNNNNNNKLWSHHFQPLHCHYHLLYESNRKYKFEDVGIIVSNVLWDLWVFGFKTFK